MLYIWLKRGTSACRGGFVGKLAVSSYAYNINFNAMDAEPLWKLAYLACREVWFRFDVKHDS